MHGTAKLKVQQFEYQIPCDLQVEGLSVEMHFEMSAFFTGIAVILTGL